MCVIASERVSSGGFVGNRTEIAFLFHRATVSPVSLPVILRADDGVAKAAATSAVTAASRRLANTTMRAVFPLRLPPGARPDTLRFLIIFIGSVFCFVSYGESTDCRRNTNSVLPSFRSVSACFVVCPGSVRLVADRQDLLCHRSKAFSAAQSRHEFWKYFFEK